MEAADRARREIERNLHDGAQQRFVSVALALQVWLVAQPDLSAARAGSSRTCSPNCAPVSPSCATLPTGSTPPSSATAGSSVHWRASPCARRCRSSSRSSCLPSGLPAPVEAAAYFVVCETLTNVAKYAHATQASVNVVHRDGRLEVVVADDGVGGARFARGTGLQGLRDRVGFVDGTLEVESPGGRGHHRAREPSGRGPLSGVRPGPVRRKSHGVQDRSAAKLSTPHFVDRRPTMTATRTSILSLVIAATALTPGAALASHGGGGDKDKRVTGKCTGSSTAKLKVKPDDGRLETEFEVDQNRNGVQWKVTLRRNGDVAVSTRARTKAPSGSFSVERRITDGSGSDTIRARATSPSGEVCTASITV